MKGYATVISGSDIDSFYEVEDFLQAGDSGMAYPLYEKVGGCILNVGAILSALGNEVKVLDYLRENDKGTDLLLSSMKENGLDTSHIRFGKEVQNGRCLIMMHGGEKCIYVLPPVHPLYDTKDSSLQSLLDSSSLIYSLVHTLYESFGKEIRPVLDAKKKGAALALDGSSQYKDPEEVRTLAKADHIFLNTQAFSRIAQIIDDPEGYFLENGVKTLCITDGSRGSTCIAKTGKLYEKALKVDKVIDSTGAGDSFAAAFLHRYYQDRPLEDCLRFASAAGARKCLYEGALGALCREEEIERFYLEKTGTSL